MQFLKDIVYFGDPVSRKFYLLVGTSLMILKYGIELGFFAILTGEFYSPIAFAVPSFELRSPIFEKMPEWISWGYILFSLPFLWIAVNLSVRRSLDACRSPWLGLFVLLPVINWFIITLLSTLPSMAPETGKAEVVYSNSEKKKPMPVGGNPSLGKESLRKESQLSGLSNSNDLVNRDQNKVVFQDGEENISAGKAATIAIGYATLLALVLTVLSVFLIGSYGAALFLGMPLIVGTIAAYKFNSPHRRTLGSTIVVSIATLFFACCGMLLFAIEGAICLLMATPLLFPVAVLGGILGYSLANAGRQSHKSIYGSILILPLAMLVDSQPVKTYVSESSVIVDASAEEIWETVIAFPEITKRPGGYFDFGIAYPIRARIDGEGIGATRYCEFTTGAFVEPITAWQPPHHLGFDVSEQPDPMTELSPYRHVHPPHLEGSFQSIRGEFRLVPLPDGRTRLEGRTWYRLGIGPNWYWNLIADKIVHDIHMHVLNHIKQECE